MVGTTGPLSDRGTGDTHDRRPARLIIALSAVAFSALVLLGSWGLFDSLKSRLTAQAFEDLRGIAQLKSSELALDISERRKDAVAQSRILALLMADFANNPAAPARDAALAAVLEGFRSTYGYRQIVLLDRGLKPAIRSGLGPDAHVTLSDDDLRAARDGQIVLTGPWRTPGGEVAYAIVAAVPADTGAAPPGGWLLYMEKRLDAARLGLGRWPGAHASGEFNIVIRDAAVTTVIKVDPEGTTELYRETIGSESEMVRNAVTRADGFAAGRDPDGSEHIAGTAPVADTNWMILATVHSRDVQAPVRFLAAGVGGLALFTLALGGGGIAWLWRREARRSRRRRAVLSEQFGLTVQASIDGYLATDETARIIRFNRALEILTGYSAAELSGRPLADLTVDPSETQIRSRIEFVARHGSSRFESRWRRKNGDVLDVEVSAVQEPLTGLTAGFIRDITEVKKGRRRIETLLGLKSLLSTTNEMIARALPQQELFDGICRACVAEGRFRLAWIGMADAERKVVRCVAKAGVALSYLENIFISLDPSAPTGQGPSALVVREGREIVINDYASSSLTAPWHEAAKAHGVASAAVFPLRLRGRPVGQIAVYAGPVGFFDDELVGLMRQLAANVSFAMDAAAAEAERQHAEIRVRESEQQFRTLVESPLAGVAVLENGRIRYANRRFADLFGFATDELVEGHVDGIGSAQAAVLLPEAERRLGAGASTASFTVAVPRRDGDAIMVECYVSQAPDGRPGAYLVMLQDVTERDRIERALVESQERFRAAFENAAVGMARVGVDGECLAVNEAFCRFLGYRADELIGIDVAAMSHPDDRGQFPAAAAALKSGGELSVAFDKRYLTKSGAIVWGRAALSGRRDPAGRLLDFISVVADVTAQHKAEEEVAAQIKQLEAALRGTLETVSRMVEQRDPYTAGHQRRVGQIAAAIAREMGLSEERCTRIELTGLVHDIGKIGVPTEFLTYPGRLDSVAMEVVKTHVDRGYDILKDLPFTWPLAEVVRQHHERLDGSGYPRGLRGDAILLEAKILAVGDVLESMTSHRPYRAALGQDAAIAEIVRGRGTLYDPAVVDAALGLVQGKGYSLSSLRKAG